MTGHARLGRHMASPLCFSKSKQNQEKCQGEKKSHSTKHLTNPLQKCQGHGRAGPGALCQSEETKGLDTIWDPRLDLGTGGKKNKGHDCKVWWNLNKVCSLVSRTVPVLISWLWQWCHGYIRRHHWGLSVLSLQLFWNSKIFQNTKLKMKLAPEAAAKRPGSGSRFLYVATGPAVNDLSVHRREVRGFHKDRK
jgi:hypothetical protein